MQCFGRTSRRTALAAATLLTVLTVVGVAACTPSEGFDESADPTAVVLVKDGAGSALAVIDLERFKVSRVVKLRSQCFSIDAEPSARAVATAQCGGLDEDTDDACGIFNLGSRRVRYVSLPVPNPFDVSVSSDKAYLVHGFVQGAGLCMSVVDLHSGSAAEGATVPMESQRPERVGGTVLLPVSMSRPAANQDATTLMALEGSQPATVSASFQITAPTLIRTDEGTRVVVVGRAAEADSSEATFRLVSIELRTGKVLALVDAPWMHKGSECAGCLTADGFTVADATGVNPEDTGHDVVSLDTETLEPVLRRTLPGMPAAIAAWRGCTLVVDGKTGELVMYGKGEITPRKRVKVAKEPNLVADMVVFDSTMSSGDSMDTPR